MDETEEDTVEEELGPSGRPLTRRQLIRKAALGTTALSLGGTLAALGDGLPGAHAAQLEALANGPYPAHPRWKFTFVNHVTTNPFFVPTQYGAADACASFGVQFQWTGSANSVVSEMVNS